MIFSALKKFHHSPRYIVALAVLFMSFTLFAPLHTWASTGVSQGFTTDQTNLVAGTLMGLSPNTHSAEPALNTRSYQLLGLVADQPLIALSDGSKEVQITISGPARALVSDINGDIKTGDKITASPISGIGMKTIDAGQIVGTAQADLSSVSTTDRTITDKSGKSQIIKIGSIPLQVSVGYYAGLQDQGKLASALPPFILTFANNIAGQQVSALRVLISLIAFIFGFVIVANMLQSAIRSNIISVGRNPLAKTALRRELVDVLTTALVILLLTVVIVYLILRI
jgi:hypothetical protein